MAYIHGTPGPDELFGTPERDDIHGYGDDDILHGEGGDDWLTGGEGDDQLDGGAGDDTLDGDEGADSLDGGDGRDMARYYYSDAVTVDLSLGTGQGGDAEGDVLVNIEDLYGSAYGDTLTGDDGDNTLWGANGDDILTGNAGDDVLVGGYGADVLDGGDGIDTASYTDTGQHEVTVNLATGEAPEGDTLIGIENVEGTSGADMLIGDAGDNVLRGHGGWDVLVGGAGADTLDGGASPVFMQTADYSGSSAAVTVDLAAGTGMGGDAEGDSLIDIEILVGSSFDDTFVGDAQANELRGENGDDTLIAGAGDDVLDGGAGADTMDGGAGADWVVFSDAAGAVSVDLATGVGSGGDAEGDTFTGIENIRGTEHADTLIGNGADNIFEPGGGADLIDGGAGNDLMELSLTGDGPGLVDWWAGTTSDGMSFSNVEQLIVHGADTDDVIRSGDYDDEIEGGAGADTIEAHGGADEIFGGSGDDWVEAGAGDDRAFGGEGGDHLFGDAGVDWLYGGDGRDYLRGGEDGDHLFAGEGHDSLRGGAGDDRLVGDHGNDWLMGGEGSDRFVFTAEASSRDRVVDFETGPEGDEIYLDYALQYRADIFTYDDVMANASQTDGGVYVDFSNGDPWTFGLLLQDVALADLTEDNVAFAPV